MTPPDDTQPEHTKPDATQPDETIVCVDCGGVAHLLTTWTDEDPLYPGDILVYRCSDCWDRWDVVMPGGDDDADFAF